MTAAKRCVPTPAIQQAVKSRETEILSAIGISWTGGYQHITCPYPAHPDRHPSWRWDAANKRAYCTCTRSDSIFDVIRKVKEVDFGEAKVMAAEIIGRPELVSERKLSFCRLDAPSLLAPDSDNQNDDLAWQYLSGRLHIEPAAVPRPNTRVVGIKALPYFDQPLGKGSKFVHVGNFPAAVFETVDRDGARHAHRIYLAAGGIASARSTNG
jgi:hypothetical protein